MEALVHDLIYTLVWLRDSLLLVRLLLLFEAMTPFTADTLGILALISDNTSGLSATRVAVA